MTPESFDTLFDAALDSSARTVDDLSGDDVLQVESDPWEGVLHVADSPDKTTFVIDSDGDDGPLMIGDDEGDESLAVATDEPSDEAEESVQPYKGIETSSEEPYDVLFDVILEDQSTSASSTPTSGDSVKGASEPYDVLFDVILEESTQQVVGAPLQQDSVFDAELTTRVAVDSPVLLDVPTNPKQREFSMDTGPIFAPAGASTVVTMTPQCFFRAQKVIATDTATPAGSGTRVTMVTVGQKVQRMGAGGTLTSFFSANALGNGVNFDTNHPWEQIQVTVSFIQAVTFDMSLFGQALTI